MQPHPQPSFFALLSPVRPAATLWRHRSLLWQFTVRNLEIRHKGSMLGVAWTVLNPLLMLAIYVGVFGFVFGGRFRVIPDETDWDYGLGIFLGLTFFSLFAESMALAPTIIVSQPNFVKRVVFPLEILPAAAVGAAIVHMLITLAMVLAGVLLGGRGLGATALILPLLVPPVVLIALGLTWFLSAVGVFFRDIGQVIGVLITAWMFGSAIFYPASLIPPEGWAFLRFNPLIHIVEMAREGVLWGRPVPLTNLALLYVFSIAAAVVGLACFERLKSAFADVI